MTYSQSCIAPTEIQDGDLLAYLEGIAPFRVVEHITSCPSHQAEAAALQAVDQLMADALFRAECPAPEDLLLFQAELLADAEQRQIRRHLQQCRFCRQEVAELAAVTGPRTTPPSLRERLANAGKQLLIALQVPATAQQAAVAVRGGQPRHHEYQAGDYRILLSIVPPLVAENQWQVEGQVLRQGLPVSGQPGDTVRLLTDSEEIGLLDVVDSFGYFALDGVMTGRYTLHIELLDANLLVEDFDVA